MVLQNVLVRTLHGSLGICQGIVDNPIPDPVPDCSDVGICQLCAPHASQHDKEVSRVISHGVDNFVRLQPFRHSSHLSVIDAERRICQ